MRRLLLLVSALVIVAALGVGMATAGSEGKTVRTLGDEVLKPNVGIRADLRFSPGPTSLSVGEEITWVGADKPGAPHSATLTRNPDALVQSFSDFLFGTCPECDAAIGEAAAAHFASFPPVVEVGTGDGFGDDGDSVMFGGGIPGIPNEITVELTNATPGETIYYFCFIHPWMQGQLNVR